MKTEQSKMPYLAIANRTLGGCRLLALVEISLYLALLILFDVWFGNNDRFATLAIHPFWLPVTLAACYYGTREGLAAAALASFALLIGQLPEQRVNELNNAWLLRTMYWPILWSITAIALGIIADTFRHQISRLRAENDLVVRQQNTTNLAYHQLLQTNKDLELRVASQLCTVVTMYKASRSVEQLATGDVLVGVKDLVFEVMGPSKFSLFLMSDTRLEAVLNQGWSGNESYQTAFVANDPMYEALVNHKRFINVSNQSDITLLQNEGLIAGPLINHLTGSVIGILKIEGIEFRNLNRSAIQNFRIVCDWIGGSLANAQRVESLLKLQSNFGLANELVN
jgi:polysaccharide biosynthesis protein PelD